MNNRKLEALYDLQQLVQKCDKTESVKLDMTELITEMRQRILEAMEKDVYEEILSARNLIENKNE